MDIRRAALIAQVAADAHAASEEDQLALAETLLLRLIALVPDDPLYAEQLALIYQRRGQHGLAIAFIQHATALDAEDSRLARLLGSTLETGGEPELALEAYLAAAACNPRHPAAWLALARLEREQGRPVAAERHARRAAEVAPHAPDVYAELAKVLLHVGRLDHALAALATGLSVAPDDANLLALRSTALEAVPSPGEAYVNEKGALDPEPP
jgi:tetratricopeptide (TPR) repeat protein